MTPREWVFVAFTVTLFHFVYSSVIPGPLIDATNGEVWPKPQQIKTDYTYMAVRPRTFQFNVTGHQCDILTKAVKRYTKLISGYSNAIDAEPREITSLENPLFHGYLDSLEVKLFSDCEERPYLNMDEKYSLSVDFNESEGKGLLQSNSIWGILRGLETFAQLLTPSAHMKDMLVLNSTLITDFPRFPHRGLLLDTSRHFQPLSIIYTILDGMESNKLNVFHWHIVDDQSFPYQSAVFPIISEKGAYDPKTHVYSLDDVKNVIEYARLRGIRVLPEFDTPGHTQSWGLGLPKLLTPCYHGGALTGTYGPIDPTRPANYKIVKRLLQEVYSIFKDQYVHIGGDEVDFSCWMSNPNINTFMKEHGINTYKGLESYYIQHVLNYVTHLNASSVVWQEVFTNGVSLEKDTVVHVWLGDWTKLLYKITNSGHKALLSECWYLDHLDRSWQSFYGCDPWNFDGTDEQKKLVLGGEACMWGEMVDESNVVSRIFPRACATAEKLWSRTNIDPQEATRRVEEHYCRMKRRGVQSSPPSGPGYCP